jgi:hypothetical protein
LFAAQGYEAALAARMSNSSNASAACRLIHCPACMEVIQDNHPRRNGYGLLPLRIPVHLLQFDLSPTGRRVTFFGATRKR